ncbi:MAG: hypothetical protein ACO4CG_11155, partial [Prochlorothrix sp.]
MNAFDPITGSLETVSIGVPELWAEPRRAKSCSFVQQKLQGTSIHSNFDRNAHGRIRVVVGGEAA